jgi:hypothetical protein
MRTVGDGTFVPGQEAWTVTTRSPPSWLAASIRAYVVARIIAAQAYKMMVTVITPVHTCGSLRPSACRAIRRFWPSVEKDIGSFEDFGDVDLGEVVPLSLMALQQCIDAYAAGLET